MFVAEYSYYLLKEWAQWLAFLDFGKGRRQKYKIKRRTLLFIMRNVYRRIFILAASGMGSVVKILESWRREGDEKTKSSGKGGARF